MNDVHASTRSTPDGLRERKKRETRARILRSAARLFAKRGFDATTIREIAEDADIARATFFNYFPEKGAVVLELGDRMTGDFLDFVADAQARDLPLAESLREVFRHSSAALERRPTLSRALLLETVARRDITERAGHLNRLHEGLGALLEERARRGEIRRDARIPLLAQIIGGTYVEILLAWMTDLGLPLGERLDEAALLLANAFSRDH